MLTYAIVFTNTTGLVLGPAPSPAPSATDSFARFADESNMMMDRYGMVTLTDLCTVDVSNVKLLLFPFKKKKKEKASVCIMLPWGVGNPFTCGHRHNAFRILC